jgi:hypothetical protein
MGTGPGVESAAVYVCRDFVCQAPVLDPSRLGEVLDEIGAPRRIIPS